MASSLNQAPQSSTAYMPAPVVMAVSPADNNAELIEQCVQLGYLHASDTILDPTYGCGGFWTKWQPATLVASDLDASRSPYGSSVDFTATPWNQESFDAVVFDPPYKLNGAGGSHPSDIRYGVANRRSVSWQDRHHLIRTGITEVVRLLRPGGTLLIKCQDQVSGGSVRWQTREFSDHAEQHGCRLVDMLHLVSYRPQPPNRRQVHARRNYSTLLVLTKDHHRH